MSKLTYEQQQKMLLEMCDLLDGHTAMIRRLIMMGMDEEVTPQNIPEVSMPVPEEEKSLAAEETLETVLVHHVLEQAPSLKEELLQKVNAFEESKLAKEENSEPVNGDIDVEAEKLAHYIDSFKRNCQVGDSITLKHREFGDLEFLVAGKNIDAPRSVTLISKHVITKKMWNGVTACDRCEYEGSELRKWLNTEFKNGFEIVDLIRPVRKKTNSLSKTYNERVTLDFCWLLSREECALNASRGINPENRYPLFNKATDRIRTMKGDYVTDDHVTYFLRENSEYNIEQDDCPHVHMVNTIGSFGKLDPMKTKAGVVCGLVI